MTRSLVPSLAVLACGILLLLPVGSSTPGGGATPPPTHASSAGSASGSDSLFPALGTFAAMSWTRMNTSGSPPNVTGGSLVYDTADGYVVLFGGRTGWNAPSLQVSGATSILLGGVWKNLSLAHHPSARWGAAAVYDALLGEVVLFGGERPATCCMTGTVVLNDTWAFSHGRWTQIGNLATAPPRRAEATMAYDSISREVVLFGGRNVATSHGGPELSDTWLFNGTAWKKVHTPVAPPGRRLAGMDFFPAIHALLLFGGCGFGFCGAGFGDTWEFRNGTWRNLTSSHSPPPRAGENLVYDPMLRVVVMFGGVNLTSLLNDTWVFSGAGAWTLVCSSCAPPARYEAGAALDRTDGTVVMTGGLGAGTAGLDAWKGTWDFS